MKGKRLLTVALSAALIGTTAGMLAGCDGGSKGTELVYWCFDADMAKQVTDYYDTEERALGYDIKVEVVPLDNMLTRLDNAFRSGKNLPDVVALEAETFKKYIDDGANLLENLDDLKGLTSEMYSYTVDGATGEDGHLYALATNVTPGIFAYRRSMAKEAFGTDDPAEIQKHFDSWEHFLESAKTLSEVRTDEYPDGIKVISSYMDIGKVFCGSRSEGWVDASGNLAIDATLTDGDYSMMEVAKQLHVNGYTGEQTSGDGGWYAGISDSDDDKIFGYFQATWGINTNLQNNCESSSGGSTAGDWAIIEGPAPYFEGGTYHAVIKGTDMLEEAKDFVKFFSTDKGYLTNWAKEHGDFMNHRSYMEELVSDTTANNAFLGGQNPYSTFIAAADKINGEIITRYDSEINGYFEAWATNYAEGKTEAATIDAAVEQFKAMVAAAGLNINVN